MKAYLVLENGRIFEGESSGAEPTNSIGEVTFTTSMTGYLETLTDPSNSGLIVLQTFPLIGNYGVNLADAESDHCFVKGYITKSICDEPSNFRCEDTVTEFLNDQGVPTISGIDTRELTRVIRDSGSLNGVITLDPNSVDGDALKSYRVESFKPRSREVYGSGKKTVAVWDCGVKRSHIEALIERNCTIIRLPSIASCLDILTEKPDGVLISNGSGDPSESTALLKEVGKLTESGIPLMGIGFGHEVIALAKGASILKLKYGHRGANNPIKCFEDGRSYITTQNHSYTVDTNRLPHGTRLSYININDGSCEGLDYSDFPGFGTEITGGSDMGAMFDKFINMINLK